MPSIAIQVPYQAQPGMKLKAKMADGRSFLVTIPGQSPLCSPLAKIMIFAMPTMI